MCRRLRVVRTTAVLLYVCCCRRPRKAAAEQKATTASQVRIAPPFSSRIMKQPLSEVKVRHRPAPRAKAPATSRGCCTRGADAAMHALTTRCAFGLTRCHPQPSVSKLLCNHPCDLIDCCEDGAKADLTTEAITFETWYPALPQLEDAEPHFTAQVMPQPQPVAGGRANYDPADVLLRVSQEQAERSDAPEDLQSGARLVGSRHEVRSSLST